MMFAEIAVDTYQDPTKKLFTYEIPKELAGQIKPGDLAEVPFGKRTVGGFIYQLTTKHPKIKTKPIKTIKRKGALTSNQVEIARWLSSYYAAPPLDCLKCQIPGKGERYTEGKGREIKTLLLVPYAAQVKLRALELPHSERKTTLIGSRSAIFTSLPNLEKIVIEEPENWAYKDERSPYYHAKDVAQKRAKLEGLKLELKYLIPHVEDLAREKLPFPKLKAKIKIVDLKKERDAGNFSPLSSEVIEAFKQGKRVLAYVHNREVKEKVDQAIRAEGLDLNRIEIAGAEIFTLVGKAFATVALIDADTLLNLPDFRAHEKLLLTIAKLVQLTRLRQGSGGQVFVQTANANYPLFEELKTSDLKSFYQRELATRKPLLYPPFGVLAKLEFSAKTTAKVGFEAEKLYEALTHDSQLMTHFRTSARKEGSARRAGSYNAFISPPYPPYTRSRGKAQLNITVRAKTHRKLEKTLALIPPIWKVIVDPESLL